MKPTPLKLLRKIDRFLADSHETFEKAVEMRRTNFQMQERVAKARRAVEAAMRRKHE